MRLPNISLPGLVVSGVLLWIFVKPLMDYLDLGGSGYLGTILWIPIGVSIAVLGIIVYGIYSSKSTKGPELVAQIAGVLLILLFGFGWVVGWDKIPGYASDLRNETNAFLSRDASPPTPPPAPLTSAQRVAAMNPQRTVKLVLCTRDPHTGWSREVPVDPRLRFQFVQNVRGQYLSGRWHEIVDANIPDLVSKLRFCTSRAEFVGTDLYITWTEKTR